MNDNKNSPYDASRTPASAKQDLLARLSISMVKLQQQVGTLEHEVAFLTEFVKRKGFDDIEYKQIRERFDQRRMGMVAKCLDDLTPMNTEEATNE